MEGAVAITGFGLVTALGGSAWATFRALREGRTTADRLASTPQDADETAIARATAGVGLARFSLIDPAVTLAERAAREALAEADRAGGEKAYRNRVRAVVASSKGAVAALSHATPDRVARDPIVARQAAEGPHGLLGSELGKRLDLGLVTAPVAACATSIFAMHEARMEILEGRANRVLVVGVESAMVPMFVASYARLGVLPPTEPREAHRCLALDEGRRGFTLCECAAALVLEPVEHAPGARLLVERTAVGTEPHDLVRAPERFATLERLVGELAEGRPIALVQPHATGTRDNDAREVAAIEAGLGQRADGAEVYASKGALGHPLGASGLVNAALSCVMARTGERPPMGWLRRPIESRMRIAPESGRLGPGGHLIVSAGFGGHVGGILLGVRETGR